MNRSAAKTPTRIAILNPNTTETMTNSVLLAARQVAHADVLLDGVTASSGVPTVETPIDEVHATLGMLQQVVRLEAGAEPPNAYVIACFGDTGIDAVREAVKGPVVGMTEAALMYASLVAERFSIITMPKRTLNQSLRVVRKLGLQHRCSVHAVDEPVSSASHTALHLLDAFVTEGRRCLEQDHAEAIILGCAGLADLAGPLQQSLGVPVIEGVAAAVTMADGLIAQRLSTSRVGAWATKASNP